MDFRLNEVSICTFTNELTKEYHKAGKSMMMFWVRCYDSATRLPITYYHQIYDRGSTPLVIPFDILINKYWNCDKSRMSLCMNLDVYSIQWSSESVFGKNNISFLNLRETWDTLTLVSSCRISMNCQYRSIFYIYTSAEITKRRLKSWWRKLVLTRWIWRFIASDCKQLRVSTSKFTFHVPKKLLQEIDSLLSIDATYHHIMNTSL